MNPLKENPQIRENPEFKLSGLRERSQRLTKENLMYLSFGDEAENPIKNILEKYSYKPILESVKELLARKTNNNPNAEKILKQLDKLA